MCYSEAICFTVVHHTYLYKKELKSQMRATRKYSIDRMDKVDKLVDVLTDILRVQKKVLEISTRSEYAKRLDTYIGNIDKILGDDYISMSVYRMMELVMNAGVSFTIIPHLLEKGKVGEATIDLTQYKKDVEKALAKIEERKSIEKEHKKYIRKKEAIPTARCNYSYSRYNSAMSTYSRG
jgi:hypothetical protein